MNTKVLRSSNSSVLGHVASADSDNLAFRLKERIRKNGTQLVWIAQDGCIMTAEADSPAAKQADESRLVGCYSGTAHAPRIASDIDVALAEYAQRAMQTHS